MAEKKKKKRLTDKQQLAIELMTSGNGFTYKEVAEKVGVSPRTLWDWRYSSDFCHFQEELKKIDEDRWVATVDAARKGALCLCLDNNQKMIEFVLKNEGYNPTQKIDADLSNEVNITIE